MTIDDAISALWLHAKSGHRLNNFEQEIRIVCAAASCWICPQCRGTGRMRVAVADTDVNCDKCVNPRNVLIQETGVKARRT